MGTMAPGPSGILCAKCEHLNPGSSHLCARCGSHLHINCPKCGSRNPRVLSRCSHCRHRLHRPAWQRWRRKFARGNQKLRLFHVVLLVLAVIITYKIIIKLVEYRPSVPD
jgi:hypothetical protein